MVRQEKTKNFEFTKLGFKEMRFQFPLAVVYRQFKVTKWNRQGVPISRIGPEKSLEGQASQFLFVAQTLSTHLQIEVTPGSSL